MRTIVYRSQIFHDISSRALNFQRFHDSNQWQTWQTPQRQMEELIGTLEAGEGLPPPELEEAPEGDEALEVREGGRSWKKV